MKGIKIYKDNFRENALVALFFADTSPLILIGVAIAIVYLVVFVGFLRWYHPLTFVVLGVAEMGFFIFTRGKKDNEMKIKAVRRRLRFLFARKQFDTKQLDGTLSNFTIVGNYIQRKGSLIAVYEIFPADVVLLNEKALEQFYQQLKMIIHNLDSSVQFVTKKKVSNAKEYNDHFYHLYTKADAKREPLVRQYQEELSAFIDGNSFKKLSYYAVFSTSLPSTAERHFSLAAKQLFARGNRFMSSLVSAGIGAKQLEQEELRAYCKAQLQTV